MDEDKKIENTVTKNKKGYGYKYTDLAQIHEYLQQNNLRYFQCIKRVENDDYIFTQKLKLKDSQWVNDGEALQGCRVVNAQIAGISNPAQEQGSALTYARRYSLLMAYGLATEDDDAQALSKPKEEPKATQKQIDILLENYEDENLDKLLKINNITKIEDISMKKASELISKLFKKTK